jgi:transcriptional regulator with XRE-family HTH domain
VLRHHYPDLADTAALTIVEFRCQGTDDLGGAARQQAGRIVRYRRRELGLSLRGLAAATGISAHRLYELERGDSTDFTPATAQTLAQALGIAQDDVDAFAFTPPSMSRQPEFRTPGPFEQEGTQLFHQQRARLLDAVEHLRARGLDGETLLQALAEEFDARRAPEVGGVYFRGVAYPSRWVRPFTGANLIAQLPDPPYRVVFLTEDPEVAAFCSIFNQSSMMGYSGIPRDTWRRSNSLKAGIPGHLQLQGPPEVLEALSRTPSQWNLTVTAEMLAAARGANPSGRPLSGYVHIWLALPEIRVPQVTGFQIHSPTGLVPMATVRIQFGPDMERRVVTVRRGALKLVPKVQSS